MITVDDLGFTLHVKTSYRRTLYLSAIDRIEDGDEEGGLSVVFSQFWGIPLKAYSLCAYVGVIGCRYAATELDLNQDQVDGGFCHQMDTTNDVYYTAVHLTPKQLKKLLADLNAKAKSKKRKAA